MSIVAATSQRVRQVSEWFDLDLNAPPTPSIQFAQSRTQNLPPLHAGRVLFITGASGSGKSTLLRTLRRAHRRRCRWIDLPAIRLPRAPLVDCFGDVPLEAVLEMLGRVGLGEAWTYLRTPRQLSDGQRWRLRLAVAMHHAGDVEGDSASQAPRRDAILACDEFTSLLDRVTAAIVARRLRRMIDQSPRAAAVVATSHEDIVCALRPDRIIRCDFGTISDLQ